MTGTQIKFEQVSNFREVGGVTTRDGRRVRTGRIYRSGHLGNATDADLAALAELGLRGVIDFRGPLDIASDGEDRPPDGVERISLPMFDPATTDDIRKVLATANPEHIHEHFGDGKAFELMKTGAAHL